jgi:hypothetical protein
MMMMMMRPPLSLRSNDPVQDKASSHHHHRWDMQPNRSTNRCGTDEWIPVCSSAPNSYTDPQNRTVAGVAVPSGGKLKGNRLQQDAVYFGLGESGNINVAMFPKNISLTFFILSSPQTTRVLLKDHWPSAAFLTKSF